MGYLSDVTSGGYALTFPVSPEEELAQQAAQQQEQQPAVANGALASDSAAAPAAAGLETEGAAADAAADSGQDDSKLNLWALACRLDKRPLLPGCACFACGSHTRAYVHHLLQAHEMTAQVGLPGLLDMFFLSASDSSRLHPYTLALHFARRV
jgi:queuine tRNA-ribosyltransferase subunit QTRTD1